MVNKKNLIMIVAGVSIAVKLFTAHYTITNFDKIAEFYNDHIKTKGIYSQTLEEQMDNTFKDRENKIYLVSP